MECMKCGSDDILTTYVRAGNIIDSSSTVRIDNKYIQSTKYDFFYSLRAKTEHLKKHCRNCQYSWRIDTKDIVEK